MNELVSRDSAPFYTWGQNCTAWNLAADPLLSVKLEAMPPGTSETLHYHQQARQFFFIQKGEASFAIDNIHTTVPESCGILIEPGQKHRIANNTSQLLEFLVVSQPSTADDRFNCE